MCGSEENVRFARACSESTEMARCRSKIPGASHICPICQKDSRWNILRPYQSGGRAAVAKYKTPPGDARMSKNAFCTHTECVKNHIEQKNQFENNPIFTFNCMPMLLRFFHVQKYNVENEKKYRVIFLTGPPSSCPAK